MKLRKFTMYAENPGDVDTDEDEEYQRALEEAETNPTNAKAAARLMDAEKKRKKKMLEEAGNI